MIKIPLIIYLSFSTFSDLCNIDRFDFQRVFVGVPVWCLRHVFVLNEKTSRKRPNFNGNTWVLVRFLRNTRTAQNKTECIN